MSKQTVLFLCTHNSARSQMAEALLRHHGADRFEAFSAGTEPTQVHTLTRRVLEEQGIGTSELRAKGLDEFLGKRAINYAIIVCARAQQSCPHIYPFAMQTLYWPLDDPAADDGDPLKAFREARDSIGARLLLWLSEVPESTHFD